MLEGWAIVVLFLGISTAALVLLSLLAVLEILGIAEDEDRF